MTGVLPAKRPYSTSFLASGPVAHSGIRRRAPRAFGRRGPCVVAALPLLPPAFQDTSHLLFYTDCSAKSKRRSLNQRMNSSRDMLSTLMLSAEEEGVCTSPRAPRLEALAELAEDLAAEEEAMAKRNMALTSSSSSSSSSEDEDCADHKAARKQAKKEMKMARKMEKEESKANKRQAREEDIAMRAGSDSQCGTTVMQSPRMADSATAMEESSLTVDNSMTVMPVHGEPMVLTLPAQSPRGETAATADSSSVRNQLLVCQGSACRKRGSELLMMSLAQSEDSIGMDVLPCKCLGMCKTGPHIRARMAVASPIPDPAEA